MLSVTELRSGTVFEENDQYFLVTSYEHIKMGRGSGNVKVKVKNLSTGSTIEKSFITGARVNEANLERKKAQFLYQDSPASSPSTTLRDSAGKQGFHFMDKATYEQFDLPERLVGDYVPYLKEGMEITLFTVNDKPLYIELPKILEYKVTQTGGTARGNTVGAANKDAVLENGLTVKVPLFIKTGETIRIDTRTGGYVERAK